MSGGGKWETQNKVRPGAYINFETNSLNTMGLDSDGYLAVPVYCDWGETGKFVKVTSDTKFKETFGKDFAEIMPIREAFRATGKIYAYNLNSEGAKAVATVGEGEGLFKAEALYGGSAGNKIQVTTIANLDDTTTVRVHFEGVQVSKQDVSTVEEITSNFVKCTGVLPATDATLTLVGGTTLAATNESVSEFASALDNLDFKVVAFGSADNSIKSLLSLKVIELREHVGKNVTFVTNDYNTADHEGVVSVKNGVTLDGGEHLSAQDAVYAYGGMYAAATVGSLTYREYPGAIDCEPLTNDEIVEALQKGHIVFTRNNVAVVVEQDINTFRTFTPIKNQDFRKGKIVRGMDIIGNNVQHIFTKYFIGKVNNHDEGRNLFKAQIMKSVLDSYVRLGVVNPYIPDDIVIEQGEEKDVVVAVIGVKFVDAMEKLYARVECK